MTQKRPVLNDYSRIPLSVMIKKSLKEHVCFDEEQIPAKTDIQYKYGELYKPYFARLEKLKLLFDEGRSFYTIECDDKFCYSCSIKEQELIKSVRGVFMHLSARSKHSYGLLSPHKAAKNNKRRIYNG